jgi:hypothetical protein
LAALAATSLSTAVSAHGGGGFSGGGFGGGGHSSFGGPISSSGGYAHGPNSASGIARSSVISRMPKGSSIQRSSIIARKPVVPGTGTGGAANSSGHSNIPTQTVISQLPKLPPPPPPPPPPKSGNGGWAGNPGIGGGPVVDPVDVPVDTPVDVANTGAVAPSATAVTDGQTTQAAQPAASANCNCLTKRYLDDGSVLFQDTCTKEAALVTAAELKLRALTQARQSRR